MHKLAVAASRGALVVQELEVNEDGPVYVRLKGRKSGVIAWLLALIGIDPTTTLTITDTRVDYVEGSLSGKMRHTIPIDAVCNLGTGYLKPMLWLICAIASLLVAIWAIAANAPGIVSLLLLALSVGSAIKYYLGKTLLLLLCRAAGWGR